MTKRQASPRAGTGRSVGRYAGGGRAVKPTDRAPSGREILSGHVYDAVENWSKLFRYVTLAVVLGAIGWVLAHTLGQIAAKSIWTALGIGTAGAGAVVARKSRGKRNGKKKD